MNDSTSTKTASTDTDSRAEQAEKGVKVLVACLAEAMARPHQDNTSGVEAAKVEIALSYGYAPWLTGTMSNPRRYERQMLSSDPRWHALGTLFEDAVECLQRAMKRPAFNNTSGVEAAKVVIASHLGFAPWLRETALEDKVD